MKKTVINSKKAMRPMWLLLLFAGMAVMEVLAAGSAMKSLTSSDNLSDQLVNTIYKDSTGYVWFGTESGVDRFDGNQIKSYPLPVSSASSRRVNAITRAADVIYAGTRQGLFVITPDSDVPRQLFADRIGGEVNALAYDGVSSCLYIGTRHGIYVYNIRTNTLDRRLLDSDVMSPDNEVVDLGLGTDGNLVCANKTALYLMDAVTGSTATYQLPQTKDVSHISVGDSMVYIGTSGSGVYEFHVPSRTFSGHISLGNDLITSMSLSPSAGMLYVSTDGEGIFYYDLAGRQVERHITSSTSPLRLRSNSVYSMMVDDDDLLWVGYYQMGVDYTPGRHDLFEVYSYPGFIDTYDYTVRAVGIDGSERLIGTREGLFYVDEKTGRTARFVKPELRSNMIFCIRRIGDVYYVGTYNGGMYVFDPATLRLETFGNHQEQFDSASAFDIETGPDGRMWVGASDGLHIFRNGREEAHYTSDNSQLPQGNVYEIFFDSTGRGWLCTENGMAIWNGRSIVADRFPKGFINHRKIRAICESSDHKLYFIPDRGDVFISDLDLSAPGTLMPDFADDSKVFTFAVEDADGLMWFGTSAGALRLTGGENFHLFNISDGIPHLVFTLCPPITDEDGNIWMGNTNGLLKVDLGKLRDYTASEDIKVAVTDVKTNGTSIGSRLIPDGDNYRLTLGPRENDLSVSFSDFSFISPENSLVEYRLEGHDNTWNRTTGLRTIHYYDISPGDYVLHMRPPGHTSVETIVRIHKESYLTQGFVLGIAGVLAAGAVCAFLLVRRRRRRRRLAAEAAASQASAQAAESQAAPSAEKLRYRTTRLSDEECKRLLGVIKEIMRTRRPYINPELKSSDLAEMAGTTNHALSYLFNQYMKTSYYDFINGYRVKEFKRLVAEEDLSRYTLTGMSKLCGFSSRSSFFRHFKNITGMTPAEYLKNPG